MRNTNPSLTEPRTGVIPSLDSTMASVPSARSSPTMDLIRRVNRDAFRCRYIPPQDEAFLEIPMDFNSPVQTPVEMQSPVKTPVHMTSLPPSPPKPIHPPSSLLHPVQPMEYTYFSPSPVIKPTINPAVIKTPNPKPSPSHPPRQPQHLFPAPTLRLRPRLQSPPPPPQQLFYDSPLTGGNDLYPTPAPVPKQPSVSSNSTSDVSILKRPNGSKRQVFPLPPEFVQTKQPIDNSDIPSNLRREQPLINRSPIPSTSRGLPLPDFTLGRESVRQNDDSDFLIEGITPLRHRPQPASLPPSLSQRDRDINAIVDSLSNISQNQRKRKSHFTSPTTPNRHFSIPSPPAPNRASILSRNPLLPRIPENTQQPTPAVPPSRSGSSASNPLPYWIRMPARPGKHSLPSPDQFHINPRRDQQLQHQDKRQNDQPTPERPSHPLPHSSPPVSQQQPDQSSLLTQNLEESSRWDHAFNDDTPPSVAHSLHNDTSADTLILPQSPHTPHTSFKTTVDSTFDTQSPTTPLSQQSMQQNQNLNLNLESVNDGTTRYEPSLDPNFQPMPTPPPLGRHGSSVYDTSAREWPTTPARNAYSTFTDGKTPFFIPQPPFSPIPPSQSKTQPQSPPRRPGAIISLRTPTISSPPPTPHSRSPLQTNQSRTHVSETLGSLNTSSRLNQSVSSGPSQIGPTPDTSPANNFSHHSRPTVIENQDFPHSPPSLHGSPQRIPSTPTTPQHLHLPVSPLTPHSRSPLSRSNRTHSRTPSQETPLPQRHQTNHSQNSSDGDAPDSPLNVTPTSAAEPEPRKPSPQERSKTKIIGTPESSDNENVIADLPASQDHSVRLDHSPQTQHQSDEPDTDDQMDNLPPPHLTPTQKKTRRKRSKPLTPQDPPRRSSRTSVPPTRLTYNEDFSQGSSQSSLPTAHESQTQAPRPSTSAGAAQMPPPANPPRPRQRPRRSPKRSKKYDTD